MSIELRGYAAAVALIALLASCSQNDASDHESPAAELAPLSLGSGGTRALVQNLDALTGGALSPTAVTDWAETIGEDEQAVASLIDELLDTPQFGASVVPSLLFGKYVNVSSYYAVPSGFNLTQAEVDGTTVYYLRERCRPFEAEEVAPWWDLDDTILVCPDSHRPDRWTLSVEEHNYRSKMPLACDSQVGSPEEELEPLCGCGPNLIRCMRDFEHYEQMRSSLAHEVRATARHVVANDLPVDSLFHGNMSFRDRNAELYYRRQQIGATQTPDVAAILADLDEWPDEGMWAPRPELRDGQHAGVLTAPQLLHWTPDRRQRQRMFYEVLWCTGKNSFGATTQQVIEISKSANLAFVHDSWEQLAHMELCTDCHARLDYGFQFFMGYADSRASTYFMGDLMREGVGPLYGDDIHDPRGEAALNPREFATHVTREPEFADCMTRHVTDYVLGDSATDEDHSAVRSVIANDRSLTKAMRLAFLRYAERFDGDRHAVAPAGATDDDGRSPPGPLVPQQATSAADGLVAIDAELRSDINRFCVACHDHDGPELDPTNASVGGAYNFRPDKLPRALMVRMADQIAFGNMPQAPITMSGQEREGLARRIIAALWDDQDARDEAASYYVGKLRSLPAHQIDTVFDLIASATGGLSTSAGWGLLERAIYSEDFTYTPNYAATTALQALEGCVEAGHVDDELEACLERGTSLDLLTREGVE